MEKLDTDECSYHQYLIFPLRIKDIIDYLNIQCDLSELEIGISGTN